MRVAQPAMTRQMAEFAATLNDRFAEKRRTEMRRVLPIAAVQGMG
jgi:hypothetical protein